MHRLAVSTAVAVWRKDLLRDGERVVDPPDDDEDVARESFQGFRTNVQHCAIRKGNLASHERTRTALWPNENVSCIDDEDRPNVLALHSVTCTRQQRASKIAAEVA